MAKKESDKKKAPAQAEETGKRTGKEVRRNREVRRASKALVQALKKNPRADNLKPTRIMRHIKAVAAGTEPPGDDHRMAARAQARITAAQAQANAER